MGRALKRQMRGLYSRGIAPPTVFQEAYSGVYIGVKWSDLEPMPNVFDVTAIDRALLLVDSWGYKDAPLRVYGGRYAPDHVKEAIGSYHAVDSFSGGGAKGLVPLFWEPAFAERVDNLCAAVAKRIENDLRVIEISTFMTTSIFAEPFIRQIGDTETVQNMLLAGYTYAADKAAMSRMLGIHNYHFRRTRTYLPCNPMQNPETRQPDLAWTQELSSKSRTLFKQNLTVGNNSLDAENEKPRIYRDMYSGLATLGQPMHFQTEANVRLTDPAGMIDYAIKLGATAIETEPHPPFTEQDALAYSQRLKRNKR